MKPAVGTPIDRIDGRLKVTGKATYAAEVEVANIAHAVIVGAGAAPGSIAALDTAVAERAPGVIAVITHKNSPKLDPKGMAPQSGVDKHLQLLQDDQVLYPDQPIAVVVADTLERAQHGADLITAQLRAGAAPIAAIDGSLATAYEPKSAGPGREPSSKRGDVEAGMRAATAKIVQTYTTPVENHNPMEPHATIAVWQGDDHLTVYDSTQGIFGVRKRLASAFGLKPDQVRVVNHFVGGGFGSKGSAWSHVALAAIAAKVVRRPVKLAVTRPQMFALVGHRPATIQRLELGATADGTLTAIRHDCFSETSRMDDFVEPSAVQTPMLYACPNVVTSQRLVKIDIPSPTFQRAPGESTGTFALESAMDELAWALKMDPLALRLKNHADTDPHKLMPFSSKSLKQCYAAGAEKFGWAKRPNAVRATRRGDKLVGWGMATATYPANQWPSSAKATIRADGSAVAQAGTQDIGTGTYTIMTQIAADWLTLPIEHVTFELGDTKLPETPVSGGSNTASSTGSAVKMACLELRNKLALLATADERSPLHGVPVALIDAEDGALFATNDKGRRDPFVEIVKRSGKPELSAEFKTQEKPDRKTHSCHAFGAVFCEVEVDEALGSVRVTRYVGAFATGKILNPKTARSQLIGGIVWGIGLALHEHTVRDGKTARAITRDLADYHVPVHADVPDIDVISIAEDDPYVNEIGAKGIGEIGITGAGAAIANAVYHATGVRVRDLPITLDKLLL